jgi:putative glutamine amidotransferase
MSAPRVSRLTILCLLLAAPALCTQDVPYAFDDPAPGRRVVLLANPTVSTLEGYASLLEAGVIDGARLTLVGVYHKDERYDYAQSRRWLSTQRAARICLHELTGELRPADVYRENSLSAEIRRLVSHSDGIIFNGGPDIPPALYGQKTSLLTAIEDPARHLFELSFLFHLLGSSRDALFRPLLRDRPEYVVLAFCLGLQTLNVATGGTLYQDIPTEVYGRRTVEDVLRLGPERQHRGYRLTPEDALALFSLHPIRLLKGRFFTTRLGMGAGAHPIVVSWHHQAVHALGRRLVPAALSTDGKVVEALTHEDFPNVMAVQFHPENPWLYREEKHYRLLPGQPLVSLKEELEARGSLDFHLRFWRYWSDRLNGR